MNSWPRTVTRQRCGCDLNPGLSAPESSTLTTRLPSHQKTLLLQRNYTSSTVAVIFTARCYACAVIAMGLCLCLCLSVTCRCSTKTAKHRITQRILHDSSGSLFLAAKDVREILPGSPPTGTPNAGGVGQNRRLSTNNWLYLDKKHSYRRGTARCVV